MDFNYDFQGAIMKKIAIVIGLQYFSSYKLNGCYNDTSNIIKTINII